MVARVSLELATGAGYKEGCHPLTSLLPVGAALLSCSDREQSLGY